MEQQKEQKRSTVTVGAAAVVAAWVGAGAASAQPVLAAQSALPSSVDTAAVFDIARVASSDAPVPSILAFDFGGTLTSGSNLAFAVINGDVRFAAPEAGDLPLFVSGTLVVNGPAPSFALQGSFSSPTRAYTFDVFVDGFSDSLTVTENTIVVSQATNSLSFDLVINRGTGTGSFSYSETVLAGGVELTRSAAGTLDGLTPVPGPATAGLLLAGSGLALRRRRG